MGDSSRSIRARAARIVTLVAALAALAPLMIGWLDEIRRRTPHPPMTGDFALLELGVRRALQGAQLYGPYSRFGFHHPGPLYFYVLAPIYALFGESSDALWIGAATIAIASTLVILQVGGRLVQGGAARAVGICLLAIAVAWCAETPTTRGPAWPWNPAVTVLPFVALVLVATRAASPRRDGLAALLFLHAFVVQTHLSNAPIATTVVAVALVSRFHRPSASRARPRLGAELATAALVAGMSWLPTLVEELRHRPGNVTRLIRFFRTAQELNPLHDTIAFTSRRLVAAVPWWAMREATAHAFVACLEAALLGAATWAFIRRRSDAARLALIVACTIPACYAASSRIHGELLPYLAASYPMIAALGMFAVAWCLLPPSLGARWSIDTGLLATASVFAAGFAVHDVIAMRRFVDEESRAPNPEGRAVTSLARILDPPLRARQRDVRFATLDHDTWGVLTGLVLALDKRGIPSTVEPRYRFMFEDAVRYADETPVEVVLSDGPRREGEPLYWGSPFSAFVHRRDPLLGGARVVSTFATTRDPAMLVDGAAVEGVGFDDPGSVVLAPEGNVVLDVSLGGAQSAIGLRITADSNEAYRIEGSLDGRTFRDVGTLPSAPHWGMATRDMFFDEGLAWPFVRISPTPCDGLDSLSEVRAIVGHGAPGASIEFGTTAARSALIEGWSRDESDGAQKWVWAVGSEARCVLSLPAGVANELRLALSPLEVPGRSQTVAVDVNGVSLAELELAAGLSEYSVRLPGELAGPRTALTFRFGYAIAPHQLDIGSEDRRLLAVAFHRLTATLASSPVTDF